MSSLLGGYAYWPYGLDQLQILAQQKSIHLLVVPGDDQADKQLFAFGQESEQDSIRTWQFLRQAGTKNTQNFFYWLAQRFFQQEKQWDEPRPLLNAWIYHPDQNTHPLVAEKSFRSLET